MPAVIGFLKLVSIFRGILGSVIYQLKKKILKLANHCIWYFSKNRQWVPFLKTVGSLGITEGLFVKMLHSCLHHYCIKTNPGSPRGKKKKGPKRVQF